LHPAVVTGERAISTGLRGMGKRERVAPDGFGVKCLERSASLFLEPEECVAVAEPSSFLLRDPRHEFEVSLLPEVVSRTLLLHVALKIQRSLACFQCELFLVKLLLQFLLFLLRREHRESETERERQRTLMSWRYSSSSDFKTLITSSTFEMRPRLDCWKAAWAAEGFVGEGLGDSISIKDFPLRGRERERDAMLSSLLDRELFFSVSPRLLSMARQ
jgi:hypothetical protein